VLWTITVYLVKYKKNYWITFIPALFMTAVVSTYLFPGSRGISSFERNFLYRGNWNYNFGCTIYLLYFIPKKTNKFLMTNSSYPANSKSKTVMPKFKLSLMMLLQYMMYAVWWVPLAAYLTNLEFGSTQKALILSSMAIGCMASPLVGMLADRFWPAQKVLAGLNFVHAIMLLWAGTTNNPELLFLSLLLAMLAYMPSWSLTSAIALVHLPSEDFPRIRVFGSVGWVASGIFSIIFIRFLNIDFDGTNLPFYCGAGVSLIAVFSNLTLPDTPPLAKGQKATLIDAFGLRSIQLMKDRNFAVFIVLSFLSMIPFAMYYSYFSEFLLNISTQYITITINWGVLAEMGFLLLVPLAIKKFGLRKTMILGLVAL
jgi:hypothetical protein